MGIFSPSQSRLYVPPTGGRSPPDSTMLGGSPPTPPRAPWYSSDPNLVRASDGDSRVEVAQSRPEQSSTPSSYHLRFDGRYLKLVNGDEVVREWPGVSGREHFGSDRDQEKRNYGPIPEGIYDIKQSRYQTINERNRLLGQIGLGEWPGGTRGWGTERVWADPTALRSLRHGNPWRRRCWLGRLHRPNNSDGRFRSDIPSTRTRPTVACRLQPTRA
jgi:hypothetical protein